MENHLEGRFTGYSSWSKSSIGSNSVASKFGGEPIETHESNSLIQQAKSNSNISEQDAIGCGPLALVTQLDFLSRHAGYTQFATFPDSPIYTTDTSKEGREILELYEKRMKIEDQFKQLKEN